MELIVIGSGTAALEAERGPAGYILKVAGEIFLLDGGTGTLRKCLEAGISYRNIDKIFYTHLHPDHTIDLIPFLFATKNTPGFIRTQKLELYGPLGFEKFFRKLVDVYGPDMTDVEYEIKVIELAETKISFPACNVETKMMRHAKYAIGYRFESEGKAFVYSGDTDYCYEIRALAQNADTLLIECSFPDEDKVAGHLTPSEAGKIAAQAKVKQVILTHIYPPYNQNAILTSVKKLFDGDIAIAKDLMRVSI